MRAFAAGAVSVVLLGLALWSATGAAAQEMDPAAVISAYAAAFNAHDAAAALDLFDQFGSATDITGHHFQGREALLAFLLNNGFGDPDAHIATDRVHVVANRAAWVFTCSCADGPIEGRVVTVRGRIVVFGVMRPAAGSSTSRNDVSALPLVIGLGLALLLAGAVVRECLAGGPAAPPRRQDGRLLAALAARYPRPRA